jgi:hypothetical protein
MFTWELHLSAQDSWDVIITTSSDIPVGSVGSSDELGNLLPLGPTSPNSAPFEPPSYPAPASVDDFLFEVRSCCVMVLGIAHSVSLIA